ncbi:hypothetical protein [Stappia sp.]|uniref:hypothetical protein n=1 Tax=Stappia sp. TaxID=1870903 RepID=UPI003A995806
MADGIPSEILTEIKRVARDEWPEDREMQQYAIGADVAPSFIQFDGDSGGGYGRYGRGY